MNEPEWPKPQEDRHPDWQERWHQRIEDHVYSETAELFLDELESLFRKWGLCLSHEDHEGGFIIEAFNRAYVARVRGASLGEDYPFEFKNVGKEKE